MLLDFIVTLFQFCFTCIAWPIELIAALFETIFSLFKCNSVRLPKVIAITGASSGIGEELAKKYALNGNKLILIARNINKLNELKLNLEMNGCSVEVHQVDVTDREMMKSVLSEYDQIDLVIANAGTTQELMDINASENLLSDTTYTLFNTNVYGVFNTILPVVDIMKKQGYGQICVVSSIAGLGINGLYPLYSASKLAIRGWAEGLRAMLQPYGIQVSIVCPCGVKTPLYDALGYPSWLSISTEKCANI
ncbi:hypothetical protein WA158_000573 [Blastocystis sp. Blastoise]